MLLAYVGNPRHLAALLKISTHDQIRILTRHDINAFSSEDKVLKESITDERETFIATRSCCELLDFFVAFFLRNRQSVRTLQSSHRLHDRDSALRQPIKIFHDLICAPTKREYLRLQPEQTFKLRSTVNLFYDILDIGCPLRHQHCMDTLLLRYRT